MALLTATEILDKYPVLKRHGFSPQGLGHLLKCGFLTGSRNAFKKVSLIDEESLFRLMKLRNEMLECRKIDLRTNV